MIIALGYGCAPFQTHEIGSRDYALVAACVCHRGPVSANCKSSKSLSLRSLTLNQCQSRSMGLIQMGKRRLHLMNLRRCVREWRSQNKNELRTASSFSSPAPCPLSLVVSPSPPGFCPQFRSFGTIQSTWGSEEAATNLFLNSSGTSTDGFPSAFNLARRRGFSSCAVRDGRETYGRVDLHSYVKWPVVQY